MFTFFSNKNRLKNKQFCNANVSFRQCQRYKTAQVDKVSGMHLCKNCFRFRFADITQNPKIFSFSHNTFCLYFLSYEYFGVNTKSQDTQLQNLTQVCWFQSFCSFHYYLNILFFFNQNLVHKQVNSSPSLFLSLITFNNNNNSYILGH